MKYLKYFESSEENEEKLYKQIDIDDFLDSNPEFTNFPSVETWEELLNNQPKVVSKIEPFGEKEDKRLVKCIVDRKKNKITEIEISELEDEWYLALIDYKVDKDEDKEDRLHRLQENKPDIFKCDQRDGLMQLLEDKKIIKYKD